MEDVKELVWFSTKDILPKIGIYCLIKVIDTRVQAPYYESEYQVCKRVEGYSDEYEWWTDTGDCYFHEQVSHWAYIPEPMEV